MAQLEKGAIRLRDGYPALSEWIARDPDHEGFMFRRFDKLTARNLLVLQSKLFEIEEKLEELDEESRKKGYVGIRCWELSSVNDPFETDESKTNSQSYMKLYSELEATLGIYRQCARLTCSILSPILTCTRRRIASPGTADTA
jgi:hypothetical protein